MEDFKLIFYIIVGIAWMVYKNYQKAQLNRPKTVKPAMGSPETQIEKKMPADLILEKKTPNKKETVFKKTETRKNTSVSPKPIEIKTFINSASKKATPNVSHRVAEYAVADSLVKEKAGLEAAISSDQSIKQEESLFDIKKFDIRTAIIYSEILKRPYA